MKTRTQQIEELQKEWTQPRWEGITRPYSAEEVVKLRGSVNPECTLAQLVGQRRRITERPTEGLWVLLLPV